MNTITKSSALFAILLKVSSACENAQYILNADNEYRCIVDYAFTVHDADEWMVELGENKIPEAWQADCNSNDACMYLWWDRTGGLGDTVLACTNGEDSITNEVKTGFGYPRWDKVCPVLAEASCSHADGLSNCTHSQLDDIRGFYQDNAQC